MYIFDSRNICITEGSEKAERDTHNGFCCGCLYQGLYGCCIPSHHMSDSYLERLKLTNVYLKMGIPILAESSNARSFAFAACTGPWDQAS